MFPLVFVIHPHRVGFRWAIYWASPEFAYQEPFKRCVNAGWCATRQDADLEGQTALYTVLNFVRMIGLACPVSSVDWVDDPIGDTDIDLVEMSDTILQLGG